MSRTMTPNVAPTASPKMNASTAACEPVASGSRSIGSGYSTQPIANVAPPPARERPPPPAPPHDPPRAARAGDPADRPEAQHDAELGRADAEAARRVQRVERDDGEREEVQRRARHEDRPQHVRPREEPRARGEPARGVPPARPQGDAPQPPRRGD